MRKNQPILSMLLITLGLMTFSSCEKDPFDDIESHERAIEAISLGGGLVQVGPAEIDRTAAKASVKVLMQENTDLSDVEVQIMSSYKSVVSPASGARIDFKSNNNQHTFTVTAESGETREWTIELVPFSEPVLGTYSIQSLVVYGGTGPEWGGGGVLNMTDTPWVWPDNGGPAAELDNVLSFTFTGVTEDGKTYGTVTNEAGSDGQYANFLFVNPETNVDHFYRTIPKGEGIWQHDYSNNTIIFVFPDGQKFTASFAGPSTIDLGNNLSKTITDNAFEFTLNGTDDWVNIYSDYDKFVKKPRKFWIDVKRH